MDIAGVSGSSGSNAATNRFADMSSEDFIRVLITELSSQDPLNPNDSSEMLNQLSSIRNIESQLTLQERLEDLVAQNQFASAGSLIGKLIQGMNDANERVEGEVVSVRSAEGKVYLELDTGQYVDMNNLTAVTEGAQA